MCIRLDTIPACDGQTEGQTSYNGIVRAMHKGVARGNFKTRQTLLSLPLPSSPLRNRSLRSRTP